MKRSIFVLCIISLVSGSVSLQADDDTERAAVLATMQRFFEAMSNRDIASGGRILLADGRFYSVRGAGDAPFVRSFTGREALEAWSSESTRLVERIWNPEVNIHAGIAVVWAPYDFYRDGEYNHCGVNALHLIKTAEGWQLAGGVYTVEQECAPSPLGPLDES